jgi:hypothetical protein
MSGSMVLTHSTDELSVIDRTNPAEGTTRQPTARRLRALSGIGQIEAARLSILSHILA